MCVVCAVLRRIWRVLRGRTAHVPYQSTLERFSTSTDAAAATNKSGSINVAVVVVVVQAIIAVTEHTSNSLDSHVYNSSIQKNNSHMHEEKRQRVVIRNNTQHSYLRVVNKWNIFIATL